MADYITIPEDIDLIGADVVDSAIKVHRFMGPGLLESVYEECMMHELFINRGLVVARQVEVPIKYEKVILEAKLRIDLLVCGKVIVELKAVDQLLPIHEAQLLTYMKLAGIRLGYLLNFNVLRMKDGIRRMIL